MVASNLDQVRAVVDERGSTVVLEDTKELAEAVCTILKDESRCDPNGGYRWAETVEQTTRVLEELIERGDNL